MTTEDDHDDRAAAQAPLEVQLERAVAGGVVLGREAGGRVVLARGGLPGERVVVEPDEVTRSLVRGTVSWVEVASPDRVEPPCVHVSRGCGGCDTQHASALLQERMRVEVVRDALAHTGSMSRAVADSIPVRQLEPSPPADSRTTMRFAVTGDGHLGLRRHRSHDVLEVPGCLVAHPLLRETIDGARFEGRGEVTLRCSEATAEVMAVTSAKRRRGGRARGDRAGGGGARRGGTASEPVALEVPEGVEVIAESALRSGAEAWLTESVAGRDMRVSARSFFQSGPVPAAALGRAVARALEGFDASSERLIDLYGGVGLFTVLLDAENSEIVERSSVAVDDARINTAHLAARVIRCDVDRWRHSPADAVVADPSRSGLGRGGVAAVVATGAPTVALVSCDPAAMARDVTALVEHGYEVQRVEIVDMFPHTHHIEAVTSLRRSLDRS